MTVPPRAAVVQIAGHAFSPPITRSRELPCGFFRGAAEDHVARANASALQAPIVPALRRPCAWLASCTVDARRHAVTRRTGLSIALVPDRQAPFLLGR